MSTLEAPDVFPATKAKSTPHAKLGVGLLTALVVGSMVGSGVFSLPQNMAAGAGATAILIGWVITGAGMIALALVFQDLAVRKPELDSGPYAYAKAGFGDFVGFNSAWGYWLSAWIGNVSYAVILFSALSYFVPAFGEGNTWQAILGASLVLWVVHFLILFGVREAAIANAITTIGKIVPILIFIALVAAAFNWAMYSGTAVPAAAPAAGEAAPQLGSLLDQVKSTMLVTLWAFIGIEGASVVSARAARRSDVGVATITGLLVCLALYMAVSLLSLGIMSQVDLAALKNPSMAGVLEIVAGPWGAGLINAAVVVSVLGAFLSWTLLAAEVPFIAAKDGTMPAVFGSENAKRSPVVSLWVTNGLVQIFLLVTFYASATYNALFTIASAAIMVPYVLSGAYALKLALAGESTASGSGGSVRQVVIGAVATLYGLWLVYAAGPKYLFLCAILYAVGILVFLWARRESGKPLFQGLDAILAAALAIAGLVAGYMLSTGALTL